MAYNYLLELYDTIDRRRQEARGCLEGSTGTDQHRHRGRVDALEQLEQFLRTNYHPRLPRRIRARLEVDRPGASEQEVSASPPASAPGG